MKTQRFWVPGLVCLLTFSGGAHTATGRLSPTRPQRPHPGDQRRDIAVGTPAPDWRLRTVEGETVALSELRGKVVVLDFWANWCGPCHKLTPLFDQLAREYQSKPVMFFTLSIWADRDFNPPGLPERSRDDIDVSSWH